MKTVSKGMAWILRQVGTTKSTMTDLLPREWYLVSNSDGSWTAKKLGDNRVFFTDINKHDAAAMAWLHESKPIEVYPCTSREMAEKLRDAGYPQPECKMGQWWYDEKGRLTLTVYDWFPDVEMQHTYAPTATELMPDGWTLKRWYGPRTDGTHVAAWECMHDEGDGFFIDENPHDAAALAWLHESEPIEV